MKYLVLMLMLGFGGLTGCSSDSDTSNETDAADQSDATDTSDPSDASDATDTSNACANEGFDAVAALSTIQVSESYATLEGYSSETAPFDILAIEMYSGEYGGPEGPGSYEIDGSNYQDCGLCVLIYQGVEGQSANKTFYASSGGVEISEWDEATNTIKATLTNAEFQEVTINDNTFVSTPVAGGETWCISSITLEGVDPDGSDASDTSDPSDASDASDASDPSDESDASAMRQRTQAMPLIRAMHQTQAMRPTPATATMTAVPIPVSRARLRALETTVSFINLTQFVQQMMRPTMSLHLSSTMVFQPLGHLLNSPESHSRTALLASTSS